jgi:hypothetical protein
MEGLTIEQLTTVGGISIVTALLSELFWRTAKATEEAVNRFGPVLAFGGGIVIAIGAGLTLGQGQLDVIQSGINGALGGLAAMGIHDLTTSKAGAVG